MTSPGVDPGLCHRCRHCRLVETGRSTFYLCERSFTDPAFRKYPPLPVLACVGYEPRTADGPTEDEKIKRPPGEPSV